MRERRKLRQGGELNDIRQFKGGFPFHMDMALAIKAGRKTATTRTKRYAEGNWTVGSSPRNGSWISVNSVEKKTLADIAANHYNEEGFSSPQGFIEKWVALHPRAGWKPEQQVWFHRFEVIA